MKFPRWLCPAVPYLFPRLWGIGKGMHRAGYKKSPSSRKIAWGLGHPQFTLEMDDDTDVFTTTCTRCGKVRKL